MILFRGGGSNLFAEVLREELAALGFRLVAVTNRLTVANGSMIASIFCQPLLTEDLEVVCRTEILARSKRMGPFMTPTNGSAKAWKAARLAVVIIVAIQLLGAGWVQEPVQPRID